MDFMAPKRIMILTDSCGLPRVFPEENKSIYEDTYPYKLQQHFADTVIFQYSQGNATVVDLASQAISYFHGWDPDYIIVQVGMADCRPEPLSKLFMLLLAQVPILHRLRNFLKKPSVMSRLVKWLARYNTTPSEFKRNVKKIKSLFPRSKIIWFGIFTSEMGELEKYRPGITKRIDEYNGMIDKIIGKGFIDLQKHISYDHGITKDHLHLTKEGHEICFKLLLEKMNE